MTLSIHEVKELKHAPKVEGVLPIFHARWSPRSFSDRAVSSADLHKVFEAARWAASSYNEQPWRFLVGTCGSDAYQKILDARIKAIEERPAVKAALAKVGQIKSNRETANDDQKDRFFNRGKYARA